MSEFQDNVIEVVIRELKAELKELKIEIKELREIYHKYNALEAQLSILFDRLELLEQRLMHQTHKTENWMFEIVKLFIPFVLGLISALIVVNLNKG